MQRVITFSSYLPLSNYRGGGGRVYNYFPPSLIVGGIVYSYFFPSLIVGGKVYNYFPPTSIYCRLPRCEDFKKIRPP